MVSVIIPLLDAESTIEAQLRALHRQDFDGPWELVVADNGSTDASRSLVEQWADRLPVKVIDAGHDRGVSAARNHGVRQALGDLLLFCDADDEVEQTWLREMVKSLARADLVGGALEEERLNVGLRPQRPRVPVDRLSVMYDFLPFASGANFGVWRDAFEAVGGFDEALRYGGDDVELSFRLQLAGYHLEFAPEARVSYRHRSDYRELFCQFYAYGRSDPLVFSRFRDVGLPRRPITAVTRAWARLVLTAPIALWSEPGRSHWIVRLAYSVGRIRGSMRERVLFL